MRRFVGLVALTGLCSFAAAAPGFAKPSNGSGGFTLVQSAALVHPGDHSHTAAELTTTGNPFTWGAVNLAIPSGLTLSQLTNLSTDYKFVSGSCWGGSPRFEAWVSDGTATHKIFFYIGPPPSYVGCPSGVYSNTGNLASSSGVVDDSQLPGGSYSDAYGSAQAKYGGYSVTAVYLDADGGWDANQVVDFDNTQVNSALVTYEQ